MVYVYDFLVKNMVMNSVMPDRRITYYLTTTDVKSKC